MHHGTSGVVSTHTAQDICDNIPNYGVFYIYTHGNHTSFNDCPNTGAVTTQNVADAVGQKSAGQCPYVFVFLNSCWSAEDDEWLTAFGALAMLGWSETFLINNPYSEWSAKFWEHIKENGRTIAGAKDLAHYDVPDITGDIIWGANYLCLHKTYVTLPE
jgi:hypothetical protein